MTQDTSRSGKVQNHAEFAAQFDGKDYAYTAKLLRDGKPEPRTGSIDMVSANRIDDQMVVVTMKIHASAKWPLFGLETYVLSNDGKTLTVTGNFKNGVNSTSVYDKE